MLRSYVLAKDAAHYDGVIAALEAKGLNVVPAFAGGLDGRPAIERFPDGRRQRDGRCGGQPHRVQPGRWSRL